MRFDNQVVIVTGASRGIGREIAHQFGRAGAKVICLATKLENAKRVADEIIQNKGKAHAYHCNVAHTGQVEEVFKEIIDNLGTPHVLVNNAGIARDALIIRTKEEDWDYVVDTNLKGAFNCIKAVTRPMMKAEYGRIVNISSIVGISGAAGQASYAASKAGLIGLTKSVAKELGSREVTCNCIAPGYVVTDMTEKLADEFRTEVLENTPLRRLGVPEDIAPMVLFLSSHLASYITGQTIVIDGGLTL